MEAAFCLHGGPPRSPEVDVWLDFNRSTGPGVTALLHDGRPTACAMSDNVPVRR